MNQLLMTISEFQENVESRLESLIKKMQDITGRAGGEEAKAWRASLPKLASTLSNSGLPQLHLYFRGAGNLALEYQLPAASAWCDVILLGRDNGKAHAIVIELKNWQIWGDQPGPYEGLIVHQGSDTLHPSEQVRGYAEYCRRFHSGVHDYNAKVSGCVLFTNGAFSGSYSMPPNDKLTEDYPCFTLAPKESAETFVKYLTRNINEADKDYATAFVNGQYKQDRGFVKQIGNQILSPAESPFELLDNQRKAFAMVRARLEQKLPLSDQHAGFKKQVILVDGPPGSGKSVVAAKIWASLVTDERLPEGAVVFTTTSTSQNSNLHSLFQLAGKDRAAGGVIKKASGYIPLTTYELGQFRKKHGKDFLKDAEAWRENLELLKNFGIPVKEGARDNQYLISIVDEAHALINPEKTEGRGQFGFPPTLGPQAWHIIRSSVVTIFLMDFQQGFRDRENTTAEDIRKWTHELDADLSDNISLKGEQFRCAGSKEFVEWTELVLQGDPAGKAKELSRVWKKVLDFRILETPFDLEESLRKPIAEGKTARLLASYARPWNTKGAAKPHKLPPHMQDFNIPYTKNGSEFYWSRTWNYIPKNGSDYTWFIQAPEGSPMKDDPLCEVGCSYAVRGFDFDYIGVLWLSDLVYRNGCWAVDESQVHETGLTRTLGQAKREKSDGVYKGRLREAIAQAYRILLTRGIYGIYLWFEDRETREHIERCLDLS